MIAFAVPRLGRLTLVLAGVALVVAVFFVLAGGQAAFTGSNAGSLPESALCSSVSLRAARLQGSLYKSEFCEGV